MHPREGTTIIMANRLPPPTEEEIRTALNSFIINGATDANKKVLKPLKYIEWNGYWHLSYAGRKKAEDLNILRAEDNDDDHFYDDDNNYFF